MHRFYSIKGKVTVNRSLPILTFIVNPLPCRVFNKRKYEDIKNLDAYRINVLREELLQIPAGHESPPNIDCILHKKRECDQ
jgi:hypothetical protein